METRTIRLSPATEVLFGGDTDEGYYFAVWSRSGRLLKSSTNAPADFVVPAKSSSGTARQTRSREILRETYQFTEIGECVLVGMNVMPELAAIRRFAWWLVAGGAAVLALGLGGGWALVSQALRPVDAISTTATRIADGNLAERIDATDTKNELGRLASVLNSTFSRLEAALAQQKQFTADAAHELRTPIAVLISEAQATLARDRGPAEYRQALEECLAVAQQMRRLTESLLQLARLDAGQEHLQHARFDLADVARECVEMIRPLAGSRNITIEMDLSDAPTSGDADRVAQAVTNLLTNATHYNREGGAIHVTTVTQNGSACLAVRDTGTGIPPEELPRIFERFYRADRVRSSVDGRSGLGLAISKAIVDANGGSLTATSKPGAGSTFTLALPSSPA
jgi:heavy metal sensor kinase